MQMNVRAFFADYLSNVYQNLAMVNYPYNTSFLAPLPANPVTEFCSHIDGSYNDDQQLLDVRIKPIAIRISDEW